MRSLEAAASPTEEKVEDDEQQDQAEAAAPIVADAGAHVIAAAAEEKQENYENHDKVHARECSTGRLGRGGFRDSVDKTGGREGASVIQKTCWVSRADGGLSEPVRKLQGEGLHRRQSKGGVRGFPFRRAIKLCGTGREDKERLSG